MKVAESVPCRGVWRKCAAPATQIMENALEQCVAVCEECADMLDGYGWLSVSKNVREWIAADAVRA